MKKKRSITLLEIMIVILLIGLIAGVVGYNLKGTLERGKAFKSQVGAQKLADILNLEIQEGHAIAQQLADDKADTRPYISDCLRRSGLIADKEIDKFLRDGWNNYYIIKADKGSVEVTSPALATYQRAHGQN